MGGCKWITVNEGGWWIGRRKTRKVETKAMEGGKNRRDPGHKRPYPQRLELRAPAPFGVHITTPHRHTPPLGFEPSQRAPITKVTLLTEIPAPTLGIPKSPEFLTCSFLAI